MVFSSVCDSTVTTPGALIGVRWIVDEPAWYSNSCSGEEWTWISPGLSAVTSNSTGWPTATSNSWPLGVTESPLMVIAICSGCVASAVLLELFPPQAVSASVPRSRATRMTNRRRNVWPFSQRPRTGRHRPARGPLPESHAGQAAGDRGGDGRAVAVARPGVPDGGDSDDAAPPCDRRDLRPRVVRVRPRHAHPVDRRPDRVRPALPAGRARRTGERRQPGVDR